MIILTKSQITIFAFGAIAAAIIAVGGGYRWFNENQEKLGIESETQNQVSNLQINSGTIKLATLPANYEVHFYEPNIIFSPDGRAVAYKVEEEKQWFWVVNDMPHKKYLNVSTLIFSQDGKHTVYAAFRGNAKFDTLVVDGKEINVNDLGYYNISDRFTFDSTNEVAYIAGVLTEDANFGAKQLVVIGAQKGHLYDFIQEDSFIFSPDGKHFAYEAFKQGERFLVVDNKEIKIRNRNAGAYESSLTFRSWTNEVIYILHINSQPHSSEFVVVGDKEFGPYEMPEYDVVKDLTFSKDGNHFAYILASPHSSDGYKQFLFIDGVKIKELTYRNGNFYGEYGATVLSDDGNKIAYKMDFWDPRGGDILEAERLDDKHSVFVESTDGETYHEYSGYRGYLSNPIFSSDGIYVAYTTKSQVKENSYSVVINGQEKKSYDRVWSPVFLPNNQYIAYGALQNNELWWVVDNVK